jgi:hypothetical protein
MGMSRASMRRSVLHRSIRATDELCMCRATKCRAGHSLSKQERALVISVWLNYSIDSISLDPYVAKPDDVKICRSEIECRQHFSTLGTLQQRREVEPEMVAMRLFGRCPAVHERGFGQSAL